MKDGRGWNQVERSGYQCQCQSVPVPIEVGCGNETWKSGRARSDLISDGAKRDGQRYSGTAPASSE